MKQITQNIKTGELKLQDVPAPLAGPGEVLIANRASLVSAGTEKMVMDLASKSLLGKARERPDHVRRVLEKIRNEGLFQTLQQVRRKLDEPMTMGNSSAGVVLACGQGVQHLKPGDRVASNGPHSEIVVVPKNICGRIPDKVGFDEAAFAVLGSIGLHGLRLAQCELGETVFVIGLGLIGQLTVALAKAAGLQVVGTDLDDERCQLALKMGADLARPGLSSAEILNATHGQGPDAILITASTKSNAPIETAANVVRKKGRIVLVGVIGLELDRRPFYFKECEFVTSCSYGPGRYDPNYEEFGHDYPLPYVRWTEQRNIQAVLDLMGSGKLNVQPLISHRFPVDQATRALEMIREGTEKSLGVIIEYSEVAGEPERIVRFRGAERKPTGLFRAGVLGVGNFARMVMIPAIQSTRAFELTRLCSARGLSATHTAAATGALEACTDEILVLNDNGLDVVFALTRHDQHARQVLSAICNGKHIFVEKPLCLTLEELSEIEVALQAKQFASNLMVGFNRRFSPAAKQLKSFLGTNTAPITVSIRFNAGEIPADHWTQQDLLGGGRLIGEACHAIDLATFLVGAPPVRVFAESIRDSEPQRISDDQCFITLRHADGSVSSIGYLAGGDKAFPKERVEVIGAGKVGVIEDFRSVTLCHKGKMSTSKFKQDKGHAQEISEWAAALRDGRELISWADLKAVTLASILAVQSLREGIAFDF